MKEEKKIEPKFKLRRPPKIKMLRVSRGVMDLVSRALKQDQLYYVIYYITGRAYLGHYLNGRMLLPGSSFDESLMEEIRVFNNQCELRLVRNESDLFLGRYLQDTDMVSLSEFIHKTDDSSYLYDQYLMMIGDGYEKIMTDESGNIQKLHKGVRGGNLITARKDVYCLNARNYIEAKGEDQSGLKFTDCRLRGVLDRHYRPVSFEKELLYR